VERRATGDGGQNHVFFEVVATVGTDVGLGEPLLDALDVESVITD